MSHPLRALSLHGQTFRYRIAGAELGTMPVLVLLHGVTCSSETWEGVIPALAKHFTVIAPDLLGHGESAKPEGDYSPGAHAAVVRDMLAALGVSRATFVGHSLGGGIAMQLAYLFPEVVERLVLVSSGGLGRELSGVLRMAAIPGAEKALPWFTSPRLRNLVDRGAALAERAGLLRPSTDLREMWRGFGTFADEGARRAFFATMRSVVDVGGQRVSALDRLPHAAQVPTMVLWGENDPIIPAKHAAAAHAAIRGSRLEIFPQAGHFPFLDNPLRFASTVLDFLRTTANEPAPVSKRVPAKADERRAEPLAATSSRGSLRAA